MDVLLFRDTFWGRMFAKCFLKPTANKQGSEKICQDLPSSDNIKKKKNKGTATNRQALKWGGGGVTPHGVFNYNQIILKLSPDDHQIEIRP